MRVVRRKGLVRLVRVGLVVRLMGLVRLVRPVRLRLKRLMRPVRRVVLVVVLVLVLALVVLVVLVCVLVVVWQVFVLILVLVDRHPTSRSAITVRHMRGGGGGRPDLQARRRARGEGGDGSRRCPSRLLRAWARARRALLSRLGLGGCRRAHRCTETSGPLLGGPSGRPLQRPPA